jgi:hypothetical protein
VPRSMICSLPAARNQYADTPRTGSLRRVAKSHPSSDDDGTMNSEVDYTAYLGLRALPIDAVIYEQGNGIGRLINALCDQCLFTGVIEHVLQTDDRLVQRVGQVI